MEIKLSPANLISKQILLLSFILLGGWSLQLSDGHLCPRKDWWEVSSNSVDLTISRNICYPSVIKIEPEGEKFYWFNNVETSKNMESFPAPPNDVSRMAGVKHHGTSYALNERNFGNYRELRQRKERIPSSGNRNRVNKEAFISRSLEERRWERGNNFRRIMDSSFRNVERRQSGRNFVLRNRLELNMDDNIGRLEGRRAEMRYIESDPVNRRERVNRRLSTRKISRKSAGFSTDERYGTDNGPASRFTERSGRVKDAFREIKNNPTTRSNERRIESVDRIRFDGATSFDFKRVSERLTKTPTWPRTADTPHLRRTERLNQSAFRIRKDRRYPRHRITGLSDNRKEVREVNFMSRTEEGREGRLNQRETTNSRKISERIESKVRITPVSIRIKTNFLQRISRYLDRFVQAENDTLPYDFEISTINQQLSQVNFATSKSMVDMLRKKRRSCNFSELVVGMAGVVATFYFRPKTLHSFV